MDAKVQSITASVLEVIVGAWVMLVPVFTSVTGGMLTSILITGGLIALAGLVQLFWENILPSWVDAVAAIWLAASVYVFSGVSTAVKWNVVIAAAVTLILAIWDVAEVSQTQHLHHQGS